MPRLSKKSSSSSVMSKAAKLDAKASVAYQTEKLEKDFWILQSQLMTLCRKDLATAKHHVTKVTKDLTKARALKKTTKLKHAALVAKRKPTAAGKKQLLLSRNALALAIQNLHALTLQLQQAKTIAKMLKLKMAKYTALNKLLTVFAKKWDSKQLDKAKTKRRKKVSTQTHRVKKSINLPPASEDTPTPDSHS